MSDLKLTPLLSPRSIAFVGASVRPNTPGNDMMRMIRRGGFTGVVHAINPGYRDVEDYPGCWLFPGVIDSQVHSRSQKGQEGFRLSTQAAAAGGVTTIVASPNTNPPMDGSASVDYLMRRARDKIPYSSGDRMILSSPGGGWMVQGSPADIGARWVPDSSSPP